ncbi:pectinesterase family protein [Flavobacterium pectinovorum]|uniref:pectinesterase family protein n=1 Tax=Flavobacterium pectinovorum TaxID=29533 RepID=UPI001FACF829|nr:pectinesterase family protein [Flavobacterium pectinovorum]MCI9845468.1 pectin esterase [Flavobacterium pectinovorum]
MILSFVMASVFFMNFSSGNVLKETSKKEVKLYDIVVSADGKADFKTVQEAVNSVASFKKTETKIFIKNGTYKEKLEVPKDKNHITLTGESKENVILTYDDYASKKNSEGKDIGTSGSASFIVTGNNFKARNITFENSSDPVGQAVAVRVDGDKIIFDNCKFLGFQDTLYPRDTTSRQYYKNCYIEGTTDFIFGASTAIFDHCEIFAKRGGSYLTAASTLETNPYGFVFFNCKLTTNAPNNSYYLGRPWRNFAKTVFIKCEMGTHIKAEGWHNWSKPEAEKTTFYGEYLSNGIGANTTSRVSWSHLLTEDEYKKDYTLKVIFKDWTPVL